MNPARPSMSVPVITGGLFLGVLSAVPPINFLNCACCVLVIGGGLLASYLYMKGYPPELPRVTYGDGALLGLLTGLFGAVVDTVVSIPFDLWLGGFANQEALQQIRNAPEIPPELVEFLETMLAGGFSMIGIVISLVFGGVIYSIFSMIGAMLGVSLFGPKGGGELGSAPPAPRMDPYQAPLPPQTPQPPRPPSQPSPPAPKPEPPGQGGSDDEGSGP